MIPLIALGPLAPHLSEFIAALVFLGILVFLFTKVIAPRFEATYAERADAIQGGMERAERAQKEAHEAKEQAEAALKALREDEARIREDAKNQGALIIAEMREQAQAESERIRAAGHAQMEAERAQVVQQLRAELGGLATTLAGRIVGESLDDDERARRTVERFITDLEANGDSSSEPEPAGQGSSS